MVKMKTKKSAESEKSAPHFRIFLRGIRFYCRIGIDAAEREVRQKLLADVEIVPIATSESSALPAVDYAAVLRRLRVFAESKQHDLMENFAEEAADIILNEFAHLV